MQAIKELYKIGYGPSSSHTIAPARACQLFLDTYGRFPYYEIDLYGSLSLTGKGHRTDEIIKETLEPSEVKVYFRLEWDEDFENGFYLRGYDEDHELKQQWTVFSVGGGTFQVKGRELDISREVYEEKTFAELKEHCLSSYDLVRYVEKHEPDVREHLKKCLNAMIESVESGLRSEGVLRGEMYVARSARQLIRTAEAIDNEVEAQKIRLLAYAYATSEENADGRRVVTAPTLGSCGVMAGLMYDQHVKGVDHEKLIDSLCVAGIFGNLIKQNATISGAVGGCQAEVGAAVAMAGAAMAYLMGLNINHIEYAAEMGIEHHLGLTCDPVKGYVIIPCIERNGMGLLRAVDAATLSHYMVKKNRISFDAVVETMKYTGNHIVKELKETSLGGLAAVYENKS